MDLTDAKSFSEVDDDLISNIETADLSLGIDIYDSRFGQPLRYYLLLSYWPELLGRGLDPGELFYGRYFWLRRFANEYQAATGFDAGVEQQCTQLLEEAELPIDWEVIENLDQRAAAN